MKFYIVLTLLAYFALSPTDNFQYKTLITTLSDYPQDKNKYFQFDTRAGNNFFGNDWDTKKYSIGTSEGRSGVIKVYKDSCGSDAVSVSCGRWDPLSAVKENDWNISMTLEHTLITSVINGFYSAHKYFGFDTTAGNSFFGNEDWNKQKYSIRTSAGVSGVIKVWKDSTHCGLAADLISCGRWNPPETANEWPNNMTLFNAPIMGPSTVPATAPTSAPSTTEPTTAPTTQPTTFIPICPPNHILRETCNCGNRVIKFLIIRRFFVYCKFVTPDNYSVETIRKMHHCPKNQHLTRVCKCDDDIIIQSEIKTKYCKYQYIDVFPRWKKSTYSVEDIPKEECILHRKVNGTCSCGKFICLDGEYETTNGANYVCNTFPINNPCPYNTKPTGQRAVPCACGNTVITETSSECRTESWGRNDDFTVITDVF